MSLESGTPRKLRFPLRETENPLQLGGGFLDSNEVALTWQTEDNDEKVIVTLELSLKEYVALASAIDAGRDIAFGESAIELWHVWVRSINSMSVCDQVLLCLQNPESALSIALNELILQQTTKNLPATGRGGNPTPTEFTKNPEIVSPNCDYPQLFGAITGLVDFMNQAILDVFEGLEVLTNPSEQVAYILSAIPGVSQLPIDEILLFAENMQNQLVEGYAGAYTQQLRDDMRCEIFCLAKDNDCTIMFQIMTDYFGDKIGQTFTSLLDIETALQWLSGFGGTGDLIVYASHYLMSQVLAFGGSWANIDANYLARLVQSLFNDPDGDYQTLCIDCLECTVTLPDYVISNQNCWVLAAGGWYINQGIIGLNGATFNTLSTYKTFTALTVPANFYVRAGNAMGTNTFTMRVRLTYSDNTYSETNLTYANGAQRNIAHTNPFPAKSVVDITVAMSCLKTNSSSVIFVGILT